MKGIVSDIIPFSLNDGRGIRTTVFLKGCPLHCSWCHNPENYEDKIRLFYSEARCIGCGACSPVCPCQARTESGSLKREVCTACGACVPVCPVQANHISGRIMTAEEVVNEISKDKAFFRRKGGATFSGGEPLLQAEFVLECEERLLAEEIRSMIETSCAVEWEKLKLLIPTTECFLCDWKLTDPALHRQYTGSGNEQIRENIIRLDQAGAAILLRCPIIPGVNDTPEHFQGIAELAASLTHLEGIELLPYHDIGNDKRRKLGMVPDGFTLPDEQQKKAWLACLKGICDLPVRI